MEKFRPRYPAVDPDTLDPESFTINIQSGNGKGMLEIKESMKTDGYQMVSTFSHSPVFWPRKFATSTPKETVTGFDEINWKHFSGVNFASQDYMSMCGNEGAIQAACDALREFGTHSGNVPGNFGYNKYTRMAKEAITEFFNPLYNGKSHVHIFSAGWLSGYGATLGIFN